MEATPFPGYALHLNPANIDSAWTRLRRITRSWTTDFLAPARFSKPGEEWSNRLRTNLVYYRANYGILFVSFLVVSILSNPVVLLSMLLIGACWSYLLNTPPRTVTIRGRALSPFDQKVILGFVTFVAVSLTSLSSTIFWALGVSTCGVVLHALFHTTETHEIDNQADSAQYKV